MTGERIKERGQYQLEGIRMATLRKLLALVGLFFVASVAGGRESRAQSQTLTAFYTAPVVSMSPMWIAKEAGFFKKQGLEVKLVFIGSGPSGTAAVLSGEVDVGIIGGFAPTRGRSWEGPKAWSSSGRARTA